MCKSERAVMEPPYFNKNGAFPFCAYRLEAHRAADFVLEHWHDETEIIYAMIDMIVYVNGERYNYKAGDIMVVTSRQVHATHTLAPGICYHIVFGAQLLSTVYCIREIDSIIHGRSGIKTYISADEPYFAKLEKSIKTMIEFHENSDKVLPSELLAEIFTFFSVLIRNGCVSSKAPAADAKIECYKNAIDYMRSNLSENLTAETIAAHLFISKSGFFHMFREFSGLTPTAYITMLRMEEAVACIRDGKSVTETAASVGIPNVGYFIRCFKKTYGVTPKQYAKNL